MQAPASLINEQSIARAVLAEQIKMLMVQIPTSALMSFMLASFVALVFGDLVTGQPILVWWCVMSALFLGQYILYVNFNRRHPRDVDYQRWFYITLVAAAVIGLGWSTGLTVMLNGAPQQYHIFLIILLISLAAAGITLAIRTIVYSVFQVGVLLPAIGWLLFQDATINRILGVFLIIFMVAMWLFAHQVSRSLYNSFRLQLENQSLANSLKQSNARLHVLNEELTQLSATDSLTLVANRRYFDNRFVSEFSRASREESALSIIMIDVDFFKDYNDELGHVAGDECLQKIAVAIRDSLKRPTDLVARYGGEEFIVLLPSTTVEGAMSLADEIRIQVIKLKLVHPTSSVSSYVTVSLGVTGTYPSKNSTKEALLKKADEALYHAKAAGRNNVKCELL
jgi:diguanylate cyclase (GGDEF)-like protein